MTRMKIKNKTKNLSHAFYNLLSLLRILRLLCHKRFDELLSVIYGLSLLSLTENAMKDTRIDRAIGVCIKVVSAYSFSWKKQRDMAAVQADLGLPSHQLISESPTRWGSRQHMIERILEQEKAIGQVLGSDRKTRHLVPIWQDVDVLESVNNAIKPLQTFTDALSGETYVSIPYLKPVLHLFSNSLLKSEEGETELTKKINSNIVEYLNSRYSDPATDELLDMASLVDPRFRTTYISHDKVDRPKEKAVTDLLSMSSQPENRENPEIGQGTLTQGDAQPVLKKKKTFGSFFQKPLATVQMCEEDKIRAELSAYLLSPDIDPDTDPLQWWKVHDTNFPRLSKLARKYLSIPATSAPSERVFSTGGNIVTCHRACLKPESVDRLVFLARNLTLYSSLRRARLMHRCSFLFGYII